MNAREKLLRYMEQQGYTWLGDESIWYGGYFVRDEGYNCFHLIEIIDLDGAAGADNLVLVRALGTSFEYLDGQRWRDVINCDDLRRWLPRIAKEDKALARLILAEEIARYGIADPCPPAWWEPDSLLVHPERPSADDDYKGWTGDAEVVEGWGWAALQRALERLTY